MKLLALIALLQAPPAAVAGPPDAPFVTVPRIEASIVVDGVLDEPAWQQAARLTGFWQYEPVDGRPAEDETEVLVWYAPDAIHFGIIARDRQPAAIRASMADRDNIDGDDHVTIYLDTFDDRRRAFFFAVNPFGVQQDGVRIEGGSTPGRTFGDGTDKSPDYHWYSHGRLTDDGYVVEIRIPFKSLRYPSGEEHRWRLQITRNVQRTGHQHTWTAARRASASFLAQGGMIGGLHDLRRGVVLEAQPFITATANGRHDAVTGAYRRESVRPELGANVRIGFTSLSLDATINPDFSQVEADVGQITANERFALFVPEKRPFFLEGIELFATPNQLVHTRRIVDPIVGGKVTGKVGGLGVAYLSALDRYQDALAADALFNIARVRRDFGTSSVAGVTLTDQSAVRGGDYNRVAAADTRIVFGGIYFAAAQLGGSWTRDAAGTRHAPIWNATLDRTGRYYGFHWTVLGIGADFESRAGFVPRTGLVSASAFNRLSWYGAPGAAVERVTTFFGPVRIWSYDAFPSGATVEGNEFVNPTFRLRGGWELTSRINRSFVRLDAGDYAHLTTPAADSLSAYVPLSRVSGPQFELGASTPTFQRFSASVNAGTGRVAIFAEGAAGNVRSARGELALRPTESVRLGAGTTYQRIMRARDGSEFARTIIPRLRAELQPTRAFFVRAVAEYRVERRDALRDAHTGAPLHAAGVPVAAQSSNDLRADLLVSYQPTPGTVAFFGYGSTLRGDAAFDLGRHQRVDDGFFVKLAYQLRR